MFTQCQHCDSRFEIDIAQLKSASGLVSCGKCKKEFNALETLHDEKNDDAALNVAANEKVPQLSDKAPPLINHNLNDELIASTETSEPEWIDIPIQNDSDWRVDSGDINLEKDDVDLETVVINEENEISKEAPVLLEVENQLDGSEAPPPLIEGAFSVLKPPVPPPAFIERNKVKYEKEKSTNELEISESLLDKLDDEVIADEFSSEKSSTNTLLWSIAIFSMILLLAFQYIYFARNQLAEHDGLRASLETMCSVLGCRIPLKKSVDQIQLIHKSVQGHTNVKNALIVKATYVNEAPFVQSYPVLELVLSDIEQHIVVSRRFYPDEYLSDKANGELEAGVLPNVSIPVLLEIVDPGKDAVNFEFNFL